MKPKVSRYLKFLTCSIYCDFHKFAIIDYLSLVHIVTISGNDGVLNLMNLPTEVIELGLFPYLTHKELKRMRLNRRLTDIADSVIEKRDRKCKY